MPVIQLISIFGSLLILVAYTANQSGLMGARNFLYATLNLFGSVTLTVIAILEEQWGFLLLEVVWALVSLAAVAKMTVDHARSRHRATGNRR